MKEPKLNVDKQLHEAYRVWCILSGQSMKDTTDKLIREHLVKHPMKAKAIEDILKLTN